MEMLYHHISVILKFKDNDVQILVHRRESSPDKGNWSLPEGDSSTISLETCSFAINKLFGVELKSAIPLVARKSGAHPFLFIAKNIEQRGSDGRWKWITLKDLDTLAFDHGAILCEALSCFWEGMPNFRDELKDLALPDYIRNLPMVPNMRVVFYGGSFNPLHDGHLECVRACPQEPIVVVPDFNPQKSKTDHACFWQYFRSLQQKILVATPYVFPGFCGLEESNPTAHWIKEVKFNKRGLVVGDDSFAAIETWVEYRSLLNSIDFLYVVPRKLNREELEKHKAKVQQFNPQLEIHLLEEHSFQDLSSTALRDN